VNRRWVQIVLIALGVILVLGHLIALAFLGMTTSNWLSGTVIGLVLAVLGGAHLLLARSSSDSGESRWKQTVFGLIALVAGIVEGLIAVQLRGPSWWLLLPWALTALAIGMLLAGPPVEKAARLAAFGFSSMLMFLTGIADVEGLAGFLSALGWSVVAALGAVAIGAVAHSVMSRLHEGSTAVAPADL
jgi:hypothetical protein